MQQISQIALLDEAVSDLEDGRQFYNQIQQGIGDYFYDSIISDIESLYLYAGIHPARYGYHTLFSHRFPFAIYYLNPANLFFCRHWVPGSSEVPIFFNRK